MAGGSRKPAPAADGTEVPASLRRHFAAHNRRVVLLLFLSIVLVVVGWMLCYAFALWLILMVRTLAAPLDSAGVPTRFPLLFALASLLLVAGLRLARRQNIERPVDRIRWWQHLAQVVLALPAATLSVWGTFTAYQFLKPHEIESAWHLLRRIHRDRRLPIQFVPQEIPDEEERHRVLVALQITDLVRLIQVGQEIRLLLHGDEARRIVGPRIRLHLPPR